MGAMLNLHKMSNLKIEIISATGVVFAGEAHLAVVPLDTGDLGFMQGHELIVSKIREGQITLYDDKSSQLKSFEVKGGFVEMEDGDHLVVLLDV